MIKIINKPNKGIAGVGGEKLVRFSVKTSARGLLVALRKIGECEDDAKTRYGNIGCGVTYLSVDGVRIPDFLVEEIYREMDYQDELKRDRNHYGAVLSPTKVCASYLPKLTREGVNAWIDDWNHACNCGRTDLAESD
ncbi:hypothetical protein FACS1894187_04450 [Synergistales bacterium]|nr:hypothetical protein FACS1894187_04450 [Synergistales bacterium]